MGIPVCILGESGSGKSTSLRNLDQSRCLLVQTIRKPLPFRGQWKPWDAQTKTGSVVISDQSQTICSVIRSANKLGRDIVIVDDWQYILANEFMRRTSEKGYEKFTDIGRHAWDVINAAQECEGNVRVYILAHTEDDQHGKTKIKTIGKMLDDKVTLEGMFTIVMRAQVTDGRHYFSTRNNGADTVKTPIGMFDQPEINNDLAAVDNAITTYYEIEG